MNYFPIILIKIILDYCEEQIPNQKFLNHVERYMDQGITILKSYFRDQTYLFTIPAKEDNISLIHGSDENLKSKLWWLCNNFQEFESKLKDDFQLNLYNENCPFFQFRDYSTAFDLLSSVRF